MAKLSAEKQAQLDALLAEQEAPDPPNGGRSENVDVYIDLSDEAAVERGLRLGFLKAGDLEDAPPEEEDAPPEDEPPSRRSYFKT